MDICQEHSGVIARLDNLEKDSPSKSEVEVMILEAMKVHGEAVGNMVNKKIGGFIALAAFFLAAADFAIKFFLGIG